MKTKQIVTVVSDPVYKKYEQACKIALGLGINRTAVKEIMIEHFVEMPEKQIAGVLKAGIAKR